MNILQLLGLQKATADVPVEAPVEDIVVTGKRNQSIAPPATNPVAAILPSAVTATRQAPDPNVLKEVIPRKGMFGLKGTLRDVLGLVGDSFLTQAGRDKVYQPQRDRERMGDAMSGFTQNEKAAQQAIERLTALGYVDQAAKVQDNLEQQRLREAQIGSMSDARQSQIADRRYKMGQDYLTTAAKVFGGATEANFDALKGSLHSIAANNGIDPIDIFGKPLNELTLDEAKAFSNVGINVYQQQMLPLQERRTAVAERQAATGERNAASGETRAKAAMISATRPRAASRAPNPTNASLAAPLLRKVQQGGTLTRGQQEYLDRLGYSADRGQPKKRFGFDPSKIPLPPGFGGIRPVKRN